MAFRLRLTSKNTFGFPENRVADSRCDLPRFASRLDLAAKKRLSGFPKVGRAEPENRALARGFLQNIGRFGCRRRVCCPRPAARGDCLCDLLVTSHSSQEVQNFRPGDGHFAQIHSQACLALDAPRLVVERGCASWLAAKSGHDLGPAKSGDAGRKSHQAFCTNPQSSSFGA